VNISYNYSFEKKCLEMDQDDLLNAFIKNFKRTGCYHKIRRTEKSLELDNNILDFNYLYKMVYPWNLWYGNGKMDVIILSDAYDKSFLIKFSISILRILVFYLIANIIFGLILTTNFIKVGLYFFIFYNMFSIALILFKYNGHKRFFNRTIKVGDFYKNQVCKSYDWELILKKKTNPEIIEIINGHTQLPEIVIDLAKNEIKNRNSSKNK